MIEDPGSTVKTSDSTGKNSVPELAKTGNDSAVLAWWAAILFAAGVVVFVWCRQKA